jgi:hypothetical protein
LAPDAAALYLYPTAATQPGALYRFPFDALAYVALAVNLGGMARGFLRLATPMVLEHPVGPTRQLKPFFSEFLCRAHSNRFRLPLLYQLHQLAKAIHHVVLDGFSGKTLIDVIEELAGTPDFCSLNLA